MPQPDDNLLLQSPFVIGGICVDPQNLTIQKQHTTLNCEPKVFEILLYFCQHPQQIISREQLLQDLWKGRVVSDNAINRKIYQLRKLITELDSGQEYIETIPKYGYRLLMPIEALSTKAPNESDVAHPNTSQQDNFQPSSDNTSAITNKVENQPNSNAPAQIAKSKLTTESVSRDNLFNRLLLQWWLAPILLAISFVLLSQLDFYTPQKPLKLEQLTAEQGVELDGTLSPNGQLLIYSHSSDGQNHHLMAQNIDTGHIQPLTHSTKNVHDVGANWHPRLNKIAFIRITTGKTKNCGVYQIEMSAKHQSTQQLNNVAIPQHKATKIIECDHANLPTISWGSGKNQLFIAQRRKKTLPYNIFSINTKTGDSSQLTRSQTGSNMRGHYFINRNGSGDKLVVLEYLASDKVRVKIHDAKDFSAIKQFEIDAHINNIAWHPNSDELYFRRGQYLEKIAINNQVRETVFHLGSSFGDLSFSADGDTLLLASIKQNTDIYEIDLSDSLDNPNALPVAVSTVQDIRPRMANTSDTMAFISDRNGTRQFWLQPKDGQATLIKGFSFDVGTPDLTWSPDDAKILFEYHGQIYILDLATNQTKVVLNTQLEAYNSSWSPNGNAIIYSSTQSGDWQLWLYDLNSKQHQQLTKNGGYSGFFDSQGTLYFSKYHHNGLYRLNDDNSETELIADFSLLNWLNWRLSNDQIYFAKVWTGQSESGIYRYDIATGQQQLLLKQQPGQRHDYSISHDGSKVRYTRHISQAGDIMKLSGFNN